MTKDEKAESLQRIMALIESFNDRDDDPGEPFRLIQGGAQDSTQQPDDPAPSPESEEVAAGDDEELAVPRACDADEAAYNLITAAEETALLLSEVYGHLVVESDYIGEDKARLRRKATSHRLWNECVQTYAEKLADAAGGARACDLLKIAEDAAAEGRRDRQ